MSDKAERIQQTRERETQRVADGKVTPLNQTFQTDVVGLTFVAGTPQQPGYPDNILMLEQLAAEAEIRGERLAAILLRNPANEYDANAIQVHVPAVGMVGHLTRPIAARLAPELDRGETWQAEVSWVRINPDHMDRPGISINLKRMEGLPNG